MKRKIVNTEYPSRITPFLKGSSHVLDSKSRLNDTADPETQGIGCKKRVRFRDLDSCKLQESDSVPHERIQDSRCESSLFPTDEPKTSEYVFFKKLKEDAHRLHSRSLHQDKSESIKLKGNHCSREKIISHKNLKSLPINANPDNLFPCISTPDYASMKSEVDTRRAGTTSSDIHKMPEYMDQDGAPCKNASVFSRKRHKLHQLVAKTLSVEVDKLFYKGHDIVSVLLSKLFPESNRNKDMKTGTLKIDTESESFASPKFDVHTKESQWTPARNFMELDCGPLWDFGFSSCWSEILNTKELPKPNFSKCYSLGTFHEKRIMELDYERAPPNFFTQSGSGLDLDIRKTQLLASRNLKELNEFHCSIEPLHGQEPQTLLLGWDVNNMVDENNLSTVSQNTELCLHPLLSSSFGYGQLENPDESFTANVFQYPIKPLRGRGTQNLLLGWDVDDKVNKSNSSTASQISELSLNCFLLSSRCDDLEKNFDDSFIASTSCTESLVSYHPPTSQNTELSLKCILSTIGNGDLKRDFDDSFTESRCAQSSASGHPNLLSPEFSCLANNNKRVEKADMYSDNSFSSCLHDMPNELNISKSSNYGFTCSGSNTFPFPLNQLSFMRKILNERQHYPDEEAISSAGFDFNIEPTRKTASGSSSDHYLHTYYALESRQSEVFPSYHIGDANENHCLSYRGICERLCDNMIDTRNWSSNCFQIALDKEKSYPLLLDKLHLDESNWETYSDEEFKY